MRAMDMAQQTLDAKQFHEVKYETFCEQPVETYRRVLEFAELPSSTFFEQQVRAASISSTSHRWRDDLTAEQQAVLNRILRDELQRHGYDVSRVREAPTVTAPHAM